MLFSRRKVLTKLSKFLSNDSRFQFCVSKHKGTGQRSRNGDWLGAKILGSNPVEASFPHPSRPAQGPTQLSVQWYLVSFPVVKRPGVTLTLRSLTLYIYGAPILDVSRSHTTTQHSQQDSSGRVISQSQRPLPDNTRHSRQTNIHAPGGIRTHDFSR